MWTQNDGTIISPQGHKLPPQSTNQPMSRVDQNFNPQNCQPYNPDDELDETDSEFYDDSDYENESELENEEAALAAAFKNNHLQQNAHNVYTPSTFNMPSVSVGDTKNYSALNALSQPSASMGPNFNIQGQNVSNSNHAAVMNALSQMTASMAPNFNTQNQSNHPAIMSALSQMSALAAPALNSQSATRINGSNYNAVSVTHQVAAPVAHWQPAQTKMHGHQVNAGRGYPNNGLRKSQQNGNGDDDSDDDDEEEKKNHKYSTPIRTLPRGCNTIRPRMHQLCRREPGVDWFQIRRMELEETFTTTESAPSSPIKDITAKLKHLRLRRPNFLKIFQRNKTSSDNLGIISAINTDLPVLRDSAIFTEAIQGEGKSQSQKISEVLLKPSDKATIHNFSSSHEKSIQAFLFRSNFPEHFLAIRLLKLSIDDVQQLLRQIDLLENVQDKLTESVLKESLSGPALMSCDLIELRKSLDLNLGHWTIFEQLITGLRQMQYDDFIKMNIESPADDSPKNPEQMVQENATDEASTEKTSITCQSQQPQPIVENVKEKTSEEA